MRVRVRDGALLRAAARARPGPSRRDADLELAYGSWYRPTEGRFAGLGDRRFALSEAGWPSASIGSPLPGRSSTWAPGTARSSTRSAPSGARPSGLERRSARPDVREAELAEIDERFAAIVFWHSLEHLRDAGAAFERAAAAARTGGRRRDRDAEPRQPPGAGVRRALVRARSSPPPRARARPRRSSRGSGRSGSSRAGQPPARRPGGVRLASRHRRLPARPPRSLRRDPQAARRAGARCLAAERGATLVAGAAGAPGSSGVRAARGVPAAGGTVYVEARRG